MGDSGTDIIHLDGDGLLTINANSSGGTINRRGHWAFVDNAGGAVTINPDDITVDVAAILVDTGTTIPALLATIDTVVDAIKAITDQFVFTVANLVDANTKAISDDTSAADNLEALMDGVLVAAVNDASATTTAFAADGFTEATDDHFNGRLITFLSGASLYEQTDITDYDAAGGAQGSQEFTVTALTAAPANDVAFIIH